MRVKSIWHTIGIILFIIGSLSCVVSFLLMQAAAYRVVTDFFTLFGFVVLVLGMCSYYYHRRIMDKLDRLGYDGISYEAEVEEFEENPWIRIRAFAVGPYRSHITVRAVCRYVDQDGNLCHAQSYLFVLSAGQNKEDLLAKVYVSRKSSKNYAVELYRKGN